MQKGVGRRATKVRVLLTLVAVALSQRPAYARALMPDEYAVQAFLRQREAWLSSQFSSPDARLDDGPAPIRLIALNARITFFQTHTRIDAPKCTVKQR